MIEAMIGKLFYLYGIDVKNQTLWKVRGKAKEKLHGNHVQSFNKMWCYAEIVLASNPKSMAIVKSDVDVPTGGNLEAMNKNEPSMVISARKCTF